MTKLSPVETSLALNSSDGAELSPLAQQLLDCDFAGVLASEAAHELVKITKADDGRAALECSSTAATDEEALIVAIACLHLFLQANWTGPHVVAPFSSFTDDERELNEMAVNSLALAGEPFYHLAKCPGAFLLSLRLLGLAGGAARDWQQLETVKLWRVRAAVVWLRCLDEPVPVPESVQVEARALHDALPADSPLRPQILVALAMLASLLAKASSHSNAHKQTSKLVREAADEAALEWQMTGWLGKKTKFQVEDKTQLVVLARDRATQDGSTGKKPMPETLDLNDDSLLESTAYKSEQQSNGQASDALAQAIDPSDQPILTPLSQALLLSLAVAALPQATSLLNLSSDVLSTEQVYAFVARVISQPRSWSVHSTALLLRSRAEAGRSRTVERGLLQLQALVDQLKDGNATERSALSSAVKEDDVAPAGERLALIHELNLPPMWEMERELALRYLSFGASKSALEIFTRLEMWEEAARCYASMDELGKGVTIVKELLEGSRLESDTLTLNRKERQRPRLGEKREAKLWCLLGDMEDEPAHYERAWELSGHTSSRAQRALGAVWWRKGDVRRARDAYDAALKINPLYHRSWFVLGCCGMRLERWSEAQRAFSRCVALEEDDAESWNNLASCHLRCATDEGVVDDADFAAASDEEDEGTTRQAVSKLPRTRKHAAFHCLRQATKYSQDSWRIWQNFMIVAVDVGELSEACRACRRIVELRSATDHGDAVDLAVLQRLVDAVTSDRTHEDDEQERTPQRGLAAQVNDLFTSVILQRVPDYAPVYEPLARLRMSFGDYRGALEAHIKRYRMGVAADPAVETNAERFRDACAQVEDVVTMLENFGSRETKTGEPVLADWRYQAKTLVRTFLGRTKSAFQDEPEYEHLKEVLREM